MAETDLEEDVVGGTWFFERSHVWVPWVEEPARGIVLKNNRSNELVRLIKINGKTFKFYQVLVGFKRSKAVY